MNENGILAARCPLIFNFEAIQNYFLELHPQHLDPRPLDVG